MINHYEVIRLLGKGGMGAVYLARDTKLGRRVAIKFLLTKHPEMTERFILEARNTALFNHENIIIIYEVDQWEGSPFMVFEFLTGQELTKLIPDGKPMPVPRVAELMVPVCRALQYAHAQGIVHRDLKPDNIQVTESGTVKVLDFGIAKAMNKEEDARERASEEAPAPDGSGGNKELTQMPPSDRKPSRSRSQQSGSMAQSVSAQSVKLSKSLSRPSSQSSTQRGQSESRQST
jgi:serine/threonine protein kinase